MEDLQIAGIKREQKFSPNHVLDDALIFNKTVEHLKTEDLKINIYDEPELQNGKVKENIIFSMARDIKSINKLKEYEKNGRLIINSSKAISNTLRINMLTGMKQNDIPVPESFEGSCESLKEISISALSSEKVWLKRGDIHAEHREDVTLVYNDEEKNSILDEFIMRGIDTAVIQQHINGMDVKFYSVRNSDFFYWYKVSNDSSDIFNSQELNNLVSRTADIFEIDIFGGDAVITESGKIFLIDINDWPSFAPVREKASRYIADTILNKIKSFSNKIAVN